MTAKKHVAPIHTLRSVKVLCRGGAPPPPVVAGCDMFGVDIKNFNICIEVLLCLLSQNPVVP